MFSVARCSRTPTPSVHPTALLSSATPMARRKRRGTSNIGAPSTELLQPSASASRTGPTAGADSAVSVEAEDVMLHACPKPASATRRPGRGGPSQDHSCRSLRSEEHTSELQSHSDLVCRLLLEKKKKNI